MNLSLLFLCGCPLGTCRAEDGRAIENVDISPFIDNLPYGKSTTSFSTTDASGSTSQAANIMEALEVGAQVLLIDEDTAATNFMIRSAAMQRLVAPEKEPITPFIAKVRPLAEAGPEGGSGAYPHELCELRVAALILLPPPELIMRVNWTGPVSSILVLGGSGDYFEVADTVIAMDSYVPAEVTAQAKAIAAEMLAGTIHIDAAFGKVAPRVVDRASIDASVRTKVPTKECILFGETEIRLVAVEQLVEAGQTRFICDAITRLPKAFLDGRRTLAQTLDALEAAMDAGAAGSSGLDCVNTREPRGDFVRPRRFEIAAAINRLRGVRMTQG